jgi:hypothetical protein
LEFYLKLLVTLFFGSIFSGLNISISGFVENPIPKEYSITKFILFLILLITIWFILWTLIAELIIGELLIWAVSKIRNNKTIFDEVLSFLNVIKKKGDNITPAKHAIAFSEVLQEYNEKYEQQINQSKSRIRQYYLVTTVTYLTLIFTKDFTLPYWLKWFGAIMSLNFFIANVAYNKVHGYFKENYDEMRKQFSRLAYAQMIANAIEQNPFINHHYEKSDRWFRIHLKRKTNVEHLPETLKFFPLFHWNDSLTKVFLDKELEKRAEKNLSVSEVGKHYDVVICNIKPDEENIKNISSQSGFAYLYCENEEQIYKNLEVLLFKITNGMYRID